MMWLIIASLLGSFILGLYIGRRLGIRETEHVVSSRKAVAEFKKNTGLTGKEFD